MKNISILIFYFVSIIFFSCSEKIRPGRYVNDGNKSYFEIGEDNNYYFSTIGDVHGVSMFSKGKILIKSGNVTFIPDSSYFYHISVINYFFDSTLYGTRKIIIDNSDGKLSAFRFSFNSGSNSTINFNNDNSAIYKPITTNFQDGTLTLKAYLKDSTVILPRLLHEYIASNTIDFFDVNNDDPNNKPWNVLVLKVIINRDMFAFTTLSPFTLKGKKLIEKNCPVYKFTK